jgi:hypothetical protein
MPSIVLVGRAKQGSRRVDALLAFPVFPSLSKQIIKGRLLAALF